MAETKRISRRKGTTVAAATAGFVEAELGVDITQNKVLVHLDDKLYYQDKTFPTTTALISFLNTLGGRVASGEVFTTAGKTTEGDGGGGTFIIEATGTANGGTVIALADGRYARMTNWTGNVRVFGAKGDGATDDTAAIQAAIDAEDYVYIPAGRYKISAKITLKSFVEVEGAGHEQTQLFWVGAEGGTMMGMTGARIYGVKLHRFGLDCDAVADVGLDEAWMSNCTFEDVFVRKPGEIGFWVHSGLYDGEGYTYVGAPCYYNRHIQCRVWAGPSLAADGTTGSGAVELTAAVSDGEVTGITVDIGGTSYTLVDPAYVIIIGDGEGATAEIASVDGGGTITGINVTSPGSGYTWAVATVAKRDYTKLYCKYGFLIAENGNGHVFDRCSAAWATFGFAFEGGQGSDMIDPEDDVANQNTLIGCSSETSCVGILYNGEYNTVIGHRMEGGAIAHLWGNSSRARYNTIIGTTYYTSPLLRYGNEPSSSMGNQVFDYSAPDPNLGDVLVDNLTLNTSTGTKNINLHTGASVAAIRFGLSNNLRMLLADEATGCKFQAYSGSNFKNLMHLIAHTASTPPIIKAETNAVMQVPRGTTANRPDVSSLSGGDKLGAHYFDTTLGKPIWHNGTNWVDATGTTV